MNTRSSKRSRVASIESRLKSGLSTMSKNSKTFKKSKRPTQTRKRKNLMNARSAATNENQAVMSPIGALNENHSGMNPIRALNEEEEEEEDQDYGLILPSSNAGPNVGVNLKELDLAGVNDNAYPGRTQTENPLTAHNFTGDPPPGQVLGYGVSKTVWSNGPHAIVNATLQQRQVRDKAKDEYNFTKILHAKFGFFPIVSQIPHLIGKKFNKFVYFSEMARKVPFITREQGESYLTQGFQMFDTLYERSDEYFMLLIDIKPDNFGIVERDGRDTLIWLDIDTQCIMAVRKRPDRPDKKEFFMKYQQLLLLLTFVLYTRCPDRYEICTSFAERLGITKYYLQWVFNYEFDRDEEIELTGYHQRFLLSCGLNRSANDIARASHFRYFMTPPFHLKYYLSSNYELFKNLLPIDSISNNFDPNY